MFFLPFMKLHKAVGGRPAPRGGAARLRRETLRASARAGGVSGKEDTAADDGGGNKKHCPRRSAAVSLIGSILNVGVRKKALT